MSVPQRNIFPHREAWLHAIINKLGPRFESTGYPIPPNIRVACSFPSLRGTAPKRRALGQCWASTSSKDGHYEIMISPVVDDPMRVAGILAHELIHVAVGLECGHKGPFRKVAMAIGLEGKMTSTTEGDAFKRSLEPIVQVLGPYPHAELMVGQNSGPRKQNTRQIKCVCQLCGYLTRTSRKWLDKSGAPLCPEHREELVEA
jgi:hypothetical protein